MAKGNALYTLQILRAIASTLVVYFHTFFSPEFGMFGVDLFFVLSGFVICMVTDRESVSVFRFGFDRVARIVPVYWLMTSVLFVLLCVRPDLLNTSTAHFGNYLKSLFFIPHIMEAGGVYPLLMPGWTLNYEMLFYAIVGCGLLVCRQVIIPFCGVFLLLLFSVGSFLDEQSAMSHFLHSSLLFEFLLGMCAYRVRDWRYFRSLPKMPCFIAVISLFVLMGFMENRADRFLVGGVPSFFVVILSYQLEEQVRQMSDRFVQFLVHIGDASYVTYLSHMYVIGFLDRLLFPRVSFLSSESILTVGISIVLSLICGSAIYYILDRPMMRFIRVYLRPRETPKFFFLNEKNS